MIRHALVVGAAFALGCAGRSAPTEPDVAEPQDAATVPAAPVKPAPEPEPEPAVKPEPKPEPTHVLELRKPVALDRQNNLRVESVVIESIEPSPDGEYPAGAGIDVGVVMQRGKYEVRASMTELSEGYASQPVAWLENYRVTLLAVDDPHNAPKVSVTVERVSEDSPPGAPTIGRLSEATPISLDDETVLRFLGHSHKRTYPGQTSPLMIAVRWETPGAEPEDQHTSIMPDGPREFFWRDRVVKVVEWQYGDWMDLEIRQRALERVTQAS